jgi:plastocyanin
MRAVRYAALLIVLASCVNAGELVVDVDDGHGAPASDAVVTLRKDGETQEQHAPIAKVIDQRDEVFVPYVEIFRPGDEVVFRNSDRTRHHVYSFAAAKSFEFVIAPGASSPPVTLDRTGEIPVGCNIHDRMITHLFVSDAPWIARSDADGRALFDHLPAGTYEVEVWHPQLRPGRPAPHRTIEVGSAPQNIAFSLALLPDPRETGDRSRY